MPSEQVEWFMKQSVHDSDKIHAQQSCTYYSIVNVNKTNNPYLSSYEQEQTWTLTRTISNNHKRYQSSIENIHLTMPISSLKTKHPNYENINIRKNRSISLLPSQKYTSLSSVHSSSSANRNSMVHQEQKILPITNSTLNSKVNSNLKNSLSLTKSMRTIPASGDFVVRI
ncbi:unnamed protein product [Rotaria sordida]|uniref:Uncharacterized protein n=1 Tax=Rotaria sordida TaxID=392033 RepID=A0A814TKB8_9BILA|nr:unnamed protein product [Rotaria sordida]CAF1503223.1 unnamed protein product [Rotaria sordida]CAF3626794.1 unnamed protein product [Rotaria sordida]CAF3704730.1 unnamed protein product [Rotaria sordida]